MIKRKTLILGATTDSTRYSYLAAVRLSNSGHTIINVGLKTGNVAGVDIEIPGEIYTDIDTITVYIGPSKQQPLYDYIIKTNPQRIIFNPGTENEELKKLAKAHGITTEYACTLVLLSLGQY
ncbi:CoA-binding protein [Flavobacterium psychrophilum]|nr:CoA-binding protein [Flavobacterium psychrophilum]AOE54075.1 CoA-binding protein [Flavobacterium psychrophilum]